MYIPFANKFKKLLENAGNSSIKRKSMFLTPEHVLLTLSYYKSFRRAYASFNGDIDALRSNLNSYIDKYVPIAEFIPCGHPSVTLEDILEDSADMVGGMGDKELTLAHYLTIFLECTDSFGVYYLFKNCSLNIENSYEFIKEVCKQMDVEIIPPLQEICDMIDQKDENEKDGIVQDEDMTNMPPIQILMPITPGQEGFAPNRGNKDWKSLVTCLNEEVEKPEYLPLIGRDEEINATIAALLRKTKSNPVHVGDAGVGKTAIANGLAKRINDGKVPEILKGYKIYSCSMGSLLAGTMYRGEFEQKLKNILEGVSKEKAILYIDEIHTICGAGGSSASDAANILKPYLLNGSIKVIGATTTKEYRKSIEADSALERRFLPITVSEPTIEQTKEILNGIRGKYEEYHKCVYPDAVIDTIIALAGKHMNDRKFPDKAIDIMDEAGAFVQMNNTPGASVTADVIEEIIAKKCSIPRDSVSADEVSRIENLAENMTKTVIGQDSAVEQIRKQIILARSGLRDKRKPVANLLFVGPTGVGKTFIAQTLADQLGIPLIKKDMSEFTEPHSVSKLFGSPAGYVGYDEGGLLVNEIRKTPYCVLLLDEIEKAHPNVYNVFLQIMDDAVLTDSFGKQADFRNVILIMTSNAGASDVTHGLGFGSQTMNTSSIDKAVKTMFSPEFRNRLDAVIKFNPMSEEMARKIAVNQLKELANTLKDKKVEMTYADSLLDHIIKKGYSQEYGARNIKRVIADDINLQLGSEILFGSLKDGGSCKLSYDEDRLQITT